MMGRPRDWSRCEREARVWSRRFRRDMRRMGEEMERDMRERHEAGFTGPWGCGPGSRFAARAAAREARRQARRQARYARRAAWGFGRRSSGLGWLFCYWWVFFPLFFLGRNVVRGAGGWDGVGHGVGGVSTGLLDFTFAGPLAHLVADGLGLSFTEGFLLLALAAAVSAGTAWIAWRSAAPRAARGPL